MDDFSSAWVWSLVVKFNEGGGQQPPTSFIRQELIVCITAGWVRTRFRLLRCLNISRSDVVVIFRLFIGSIACADCNSRYPGSSSRSRGQVACEEDQIAPETRAEVVPGGIELRATSIVELSFFQ